MLPPTPLEVQKYWPVERVARPPRKALSGGTPMSNDLVALFRAQLEIIQQQNAVEARALCPGLGCGNDRGAWRPRSPPFACTHFA